MASRRLPFLSFAFIGLVAPGCATSGTVKDLDPSPNTDWLGVTPGDEAGSETELAADMAELFASTAQLRVAPVPGDSGLQNISRLLHDPHIDAGFVSTDVLADANAQNAFPNLAKKLEVVARTGLDHDDYPNLIEMETEIPSVATGLVLVTAAEKDDAGHTARVARLVDTVFARFSELKRHGQHPKWREINLAANLPGWKRNLAAVAWLSQHSDVSAQSGPQADIEAGAVQSSLPAGQDPREALFKQFIEWQRARGH